MHSSFSLILTNSLQLHWDILASSVYVPHTFGKHPFFLTVALPVWRVLHNPPLTANVKKNMQRATFSWSHHHRCSCRPCDQFSFYGPGCTLQLSSLLKNRLVQMICNHKVTMNPHLLDVCNKRRIRRSLQSVGSFTSTWNHLLSQHYKTSLNLFLLIIIKNY